MADLKRMTQVHLKDKDGHYLQKTIPVGALDKNVLITDDNGDPVKNSNEEPIDLHEKLNSMKDTDNSHNTRITNLEKHVSDINTVVKNNMKTKIVNSSSDLPRPGDVNTDYYYPSNDTNFNYYKKDSNSGEISKSTDANLQFLVHKRWIEKSDSDGNKTGSYQLVGMDKSAITAMINGIDLKVQALQDQVGQDADKDSKDKKSLQTSITELNNQIFDKTTDGRPVMGLKSTVNQLQSRSDKIFNNIYDSEGNSNITKNTNSINAIQDTIGKNPGFSGTIEDNIVSLHKQLGEDKKSEEDIQTAVSDIQTTLKTNTYTDQQVDNKATQIANNAAASVAYTLKFLSGTQSLPEKGEDRTIYFKPNDRNTYDKYWYVNNKWDDFSSSSTLVVDRLPETGSASVDYIVAVGNGYMYYKWINNKWRVIAGSMSEIVINLPKTGDSFTDYYKKSVDSVGNEYYTHYKWSNDNNKFIQVNAESYDKYQIDDLLSKTTPNIVNSLPTTGEQGVNYFVKIPGSNNYIHYIYHDGAYHAASTDTYSKTEIDNKFNDLQNNTIISNMNKKINSAIKTITADQNVLTLSTVDGNTSTVTVEGGKKFESWAANHINAAGDEDNENYYLHLYDKDDNDVIPAITLPAGTGGGQAGSVTNITFKRVTDSSLTLTPNDKTLITVTWQDKDDDDDRKMANYTWKDVTDSNNITTVMSGHIDVGYSTEEQTLTPDSPNSAYQGKITFDLSSFNTTAGTRKYTLTFTDSLGNVSSKTWTIQMVDLKITSDFNSARTYTVGQDVDFSYTPYGAIAKDTHFILDGTEIYTLTNNTANNTPMSYKISGATYGTHGAHMLEVYMTATLNGVTIETNHIKKDIVWFNAQQDSSGNYQLPVISSSYRGQTLNINQYDTVTIDYNVFDPTTNFPTVIKTVDGTKIGEQKLSKSTGNTWIYQANTIQDDDEATHTLQLAVTNSAGTTTIDITLKVKKIKLDVAPVTGNLQVDFNPVGKTNDSTDRIWSNDNYKMTVSDNFDWTNGGYKTDPDTGESYFLIKAGTSINLNYYMFPTKASKESPDVTGADMKIVFRTQNVQNADAVWFSNVESTTVNEATQLVGIQLGVHSGWLKTQKASNSDNGEVAATNTYLYIPYSEQDTIEVDIDIDPLDTSNTGNSAFIMSYEDGVPSKAYVYYADDRLNQITPQPITIGSDECDIRIYRLKIYNKNLSTEAVMRNFIADARSTTQMLDRYKRNSIYYDATSGEYFPYSSKGTLSPERLATKIPNVKVLKLETDHFTKNKKTFVKCSLQCIHAPGGDLYPADEYYDNWKFENGYHAGQGTTSDLYGDAGRNVDFLFNCDGKHKPSDKVYKDVPVETDYISKLTLGWHGSKENSPDAKTFTCGDWEDTDAKVQLTPTSVPNNFFNMKVNIASSENVNNALLQKRYDDYLPFTSPAVTRWLQVANRKGKTNTIHACNDMSFVPAILFIRETNETQDADGNYTSHTEFNDTNWHFYALGNIGDSKKTDYTRAYDPTDMNEFTIEISDNGRNNAQFQSGVYIDSDGNYQVETYHIQKSLDDGQVVETYKTDTTSDNFVQAIPKDKIDTLWNAKTKIRVVNNTGDAQYDTQTERECYANMRHETLLNEGYDGDHSFQPRYACCGDFRDGKLVNATHGTSTEEKTQIKKNNKIWQAFYEWVVTATDDQFRNELEEWVVKQAVCYFYVFTDTYTMMDNRAKNTFWHFGRVGTYRKVSRPTDIMISTYSELRSDGTYAKTTDKTVNSTKTYYTDYAFDLWDYDNDTALGINNNGQLIFPYGKEDIDYNIDNQPSSGYVFNGAKSTFWCRLRDNFSDTIKSIYNGQKGDQCFQASSLISEFDNFQECFPEEIWRLDIQRKYIRPYLGTSLDNSIAKTSIRYLRDMMQGRKKYQRRQWVRDQEIYFDTKFENPRVTSDRNTIALRCYTPDNVVVAPNYSMNITPYQDMYVTVKYGDRVVKKRGKAGQECLIPSSQNDMGGDTAVYICAASRIQAVNDLSACYARVTDFSKAEKLKKLVVGSTVEGYNNPKLSQVRLAKTNKLLEYLDVRNCSALASLGEGVSECTNLKTLYAEGTKLSSVAFATNGKLETIHLPDSINTLTMRNLNNLTDFSATLSNITNLTIEGGKLDNKNIINNALTTLQELHWYNLKESFADTKMLNNIYKLSYSILTGTADITGNVRLREISNYNTKWSDLIVTYNDNKVIKQWKVTFYDSDGVTPLKDKNGKQYVQYVDNNNNAENPITIGDIDTPTKTSDEKYTYTFANWGRFDSDAQEASLRDSSGSYLWNTQTDTSAKLITADTSFVACYTKTKQQYTVKWYRAEGENPIATKSGVEYGSEVVFPNGIPSYTQAEFKDKQGLNGSYKVFKGWDRSTGYIVGDTNVYAQWIEMTHSINDTSTYNIGDLNTAELYCIINDYYQLGADASSYGIAANDPITINVGHDLDFSNVKETQNGYVKSWLLSYSSIDSTTKTFIYNDGANDNEMFFSGPTMKDANTGKQASNRYKQVVDTGITLDLTKAFTLAVDYEFADGNTSSENVLLAFGSSPSLKLYYDTTLNNPCINWGSSQQVPVGTGRTRGILVLRHKHTQNAADSENYTIHYDAFVPASNTTYSGQIKTARFLHSTALPQTSAKLFIGGKAISTSTNSSAPGVGWIHWMKLWYDDLGASNSQFLAAWPHEKWAFKVTNSGEETLGGKYQTANEQDTHITFIMDQLLPLKYYMTTESGTTEGWQSSSMRTFLNTLVFNAFPVDWQFLIETMKVQSIAGYSKTDGKVTYTEDKICLPCLVETGLEGPEDIYQTQGDRGGMSTLTSDLKRVKWLGLVNSHTEKEDFGSDGKYDKTDPTDPEYQQAIGKTNLTIKEGDIWKRDSGRYYMYISNDTLNRHYFESGNDASTSSISSNVKAAGTQGGMWLLGSYWATRSLIYNSQSGDYEGIGPFGGYVNISSTNPYGILFFFSI